MKILCPSCSFPCSLEEHETAINMMRCPDCGIIFEEKVSE